MTESQKKSFPKVLAGTITGASFLYEKLFDLVPESKKLLENTSLGQTKPNAYFCHW